MKQIYRKELLENLKAAVPALVIFSVLLWYAYLACARITEIKPGYDDRLAGSGNITLLQPLLAGNVVMSATVFCALLGGLLGWLQIHAERHRDLRAFLLHRPMSRTRMFLAKVAAGLTLYAFAAGLPLVCLVAVVATPGKIAAPFEWAMTLRVAAPFLAGIVCYFAGMLTGVRQARWYASRGLGVVVAILVSFVGAEIAIFWPNLIVFAVAAPLLALAVWGSFSTGGYYRGQPVAGKVSLTLIFTTSAFAVIVFGLEFGGSILSPEKDYRWTSYEMTRDGTIYQVTHGVGQEIEIKDLNGVLLKDEKTGLPMDQNEFSKRVNRGAGFSPEFDRQKKPHVVNPDDPGFFGVWRVTHDEIWYFLDHSGTVVGYDRATRRIIGGLGPNGFAREVSPALGRFDRTLTQQQHFGMGMYAERMIATDTTVYDVNITNRTTTPVFTTTTNDPVGAIAAMPRTNGFGFGVLTRGYVHLLGPRGNLIWRAPYEPGYPDYKFVQLYALQEPGETALWFSPSPEAEKKAGRKLPTKVKWLAPDGKVAKQTDLPALPQLQNPPGLTEHLLSLCAPLSFVSIGFIIEGPTKGNLSMLTFSVIGAAVSLGIGLWLGRRYSFSGRAKAGWAVFNFLFGIPGLLAFLSVQEWPAREACPDCKKLRVVDRERCEHCGAAFAPSEKNGIEIFEPLETHASP